MEFILDRLSSWLTLEPFIGLLMIITATALFLRKYRQIQEEKEKFWFWFKKILEALGTALLFLGLLWAARAILNDNYYTFTSTHGRVSEVNYRAVENKWGGRHIQRELSVYHTIEKEVLEEIPREDPEKPPLYRKRAKTVTIDQNSILDFSGVVDIKPNRRKVGSAFYSGFETFLHFTYSVINDSEYETDAHFRIPLSTTLTMYNNFVILYNGENISNLLRFSKDSVSWLIKMASLEKAEVTVQYQTRGLEYFYYQIPYSRYINNFNLKLTVHDLPVSEVNYPEGCLPPTEEIVPLEDGTGSVLEWKFDKTLTTAGMGIALPMPEQPGERVALVLADSPYALMMLIIAISLTLLLYEKKISFLDTALILGVYCLLFLLMASLSDFLIGFWGSLVLGTIMVMGLSLLLFRNHRPFTKICSLSLIAFFTLIYPILNQLTDARDSINGIIMILLIVYLFFIVLYSRITKSEEKK